jgi:hypothetical protein
MRITGRTGTTEYLRPGPGENHQPARPFMEGKNPGTGGNFPAYPASVSGSLVMYPAFGKTGRFIMFLYPFTSTGTSREKPLIVRRVAKMFYCKFRIFKRTARIYG